MRNLIYVLADGTVVRTMNEANASGQKYTVDFEDVTVEKSAPLLPIQEARRIRI
jgi:hypothetical protein